MIKILKLFFAFFHTKNECMHTSVHPFKGSRYFFYLFISLGNETTGEVTAIRDSNSGIHTWSVCWFESGSL